MHLETMTSLTSKQTRGGNRKANHKPVTLDDLRKASAESSLNRIFSVDLNDRGLVDVPEVLRELPGIKCLNLSFNSISDITPILVHSNLRELQMNSNRVTASADFSRLRELRSLSLQHNKLTSVPTGITKLRKLETIRLDGNEIQGTISKFPSSLRVLDLSRNLLKRISGLELAVALEELSLGNNYLETVTGLSKCMALESLDLSCNNVTSCTALKSLCRLKVLNVAGNSLAVLDALPDLAQLEELDLSRNQFRSIDGLSDKFPDLEILDIKSNLLDSSALDEVSKLRNLVELSIDDQLVEEDPSRWSSVVAKLVGLEVVNSVTLNPIAPEASQSPTRPVTAISRTIEASDFNAQLDALSGGTNAAEQAIKSQFTHIRALVSALDTSHMDSTSMSSTSMSEPVPSRSLELSRPVSRSSARSRLQSARAFASAAASAPTVSRPATAKGSRRTTPQGPMRPRPPSGPRPPPAHGSRQLK